MTNVIASRSYSLDIHSLVTFVTVNIAGLIIWTLMNILFVRQLNFPVYLPPIVDGSILNSISNSLAVTEPTVAGSSTVPDFIQEAGASSLSELWALSAEEHYVRVHGSFGSRLVRHGFAAAVAKVVGLGMQVHRSHWVAFGAAIKVHGGNEVQLRDGTSIPVSARFRQAVLFARPALES